ncbi:hypothetical protein SNEBB_003268 [Seison nebaliae]|nr:hypothetical protein SNEBB_003268 [Seison nebaliae]
MNADKDCNIVPNIRNDISIRDTVTDTVTDMSLNDNGSRVAVIDCKGKILVYSVTLSNPKMWQLQKHNIIDSKQVNNGAWRLVWAPSSFGEIICVWSPYESQIHLFKLCVLNSERQWRQFYEFESQSESVYYTDIKFFPHQVSKKLKLMLCRDDGVIEERQHFIDKRTCSFNIIQRIDLKKYFVDFDSGIKLKYHISFSSSSFSSTLMIVGIESPSIHLESDSSTLVFAHVPINSQHHETNIQKENDEDEEQLSFEREENSSEVEERWCMWSRHRFVDSTFNFIKNKSELHGADELFLNCLKSNVNSITIAPCLARSYHICAIGSRRLYIFALKPIIPKNVIIKENQPNLTTDKFYSGVCDYEIYNLGVFSSQNDQPIFQMNWDLTGNVLATSSQDGNVQTWKANHLNKFMPGKKIKSKNLINRFELMSCDVQPTMNLSTFTQES